MTANTRRYDLDWLRVIAFGLLIFYHIGMYYVTWGWHVKSPHAGAAAEPLMLLLNPWRLSLLFLISGVALRFAVDKASSPLKFAGRRFSRLFMPLVFGMLVIVTPQSYFELLANGEIEAGYLAFWGRYLTGDDSFSVTVPTWNHLWYVVYLLAYTLIIIPLMPLVRRFANWLDSERFEKLISGGRLFIVPALLFIAYRFTTDMAFPRETHDLVHDWGAHARYGSYFLIGLLIAKNEIFWRVLAKTWRLGALLVAGLAVVLSGLWANWDWVSEQTVLLALARALRPLYAWAMIATLMGAAQAYLNHSSPRLTYLTTAIFPYYILHQSLIVVVGVGASSLGLPVGPEFLLVLVGTTAGCVALYELVIKRVPLLWPLFGVPAQSKNTSTPRPIAAE